MAKEERSREVETFDGTTKRKDDRVKREEGEGQGGREGRSCPLCLGTGHLHRKTFHGKFFTRRRGFSPKLVARLFTTG